MGFFEQPIAGDTVIREVPEPPGSKQPSWIPGIVALELVAALSNEGAIVLRDVYAFPDGFVLSVIGLIHRNASLRMRPTDNVRTIEVPGEKGPERIQIGTWVLPDWSDPGTANEGLHDNFMRLGVRWPDGRTATNFDRKLMVPKAFHEPRIELDYADGGDRSKIQGYWLTPVPATGQLHVFVQWPAYGIEETEVTLDARAISDASQRARPVWPDETEGSEPVPDPGRPRSQRSHGRWCP